MPSLSVTIAFCITVGIGAAVQAITGFGFALVVVPVTAALIGPKAGIGLATAVGIVTPAVMAWQGRHVVVRGSLGRILGAAIAGAPLGLLALSRLPSTTLKVLIAVAVLVSVTFLWFAPRIERGGSTIDLLAGFASGALAASVGTNGPPVVLALQARHLPPDPFRATASACFAAINTAVFVVFVATGHIDWSVMPLALWSLPTLAAGWWVGMRVRGHVPVERFRHLVLALLATSAVTSVMIAIA